MMRKVVICVICVLAMLYIASANDSSSVKYLIYGSWNANFHSADFRKLNEIPNCCYEFKTGSGTGYSIGFGLENQLSDRFWIANRLLMMNQSGILTRREPTVFLTPGGNMTGVFEHSIDGKIFNVGWEPSIIFEPIPSLFLSVGGRLGLNYITEFSQAETIVSPDGYGTFMDSLGNDSGQRVRNEFAGEIPLAEYLQYGLTGAIQYELPASASGNFIIAPEVSYYYPLSEIAAHTSWEIASFRLGVALKYTPSQLKEIIEERYIIDSIRTISGKIEKQLVKKGIEKRDTVIEKRSDYIAQIHSIRRTDTVFVPKVYRIEADIVAVGVDETGKEIENPKFVLEEYVSNRLDPLLNYVFFDENSADIPERYRSLSNTEAEQFTIKSLFRNSTMEIYYNVLNIVGRRMLENPTAKLVITGCNADINEEKANKILSKNRAETVKHYLSKIWGIANDRLIIKTRNLSAEASTPKDEPQKAAENRRVELYSANSEILKPIFIEKSDYKANPPIARFKPQVTAEAGLDEWNFSAEREAGIGIQDRGEGMPPVAIDWRLDSLENTPTEKVAPIRYMIQVKDNKGNTKIVEDKTLPVELVKIFGKKIEKFSLILFEFNRSDITGQNKEIIDFISGRVAEESEVIIMGYTDRTGNDNYNQVLSERRAISAGKKLGQKSAEVIGKGESELLYSNDLPEGRFYCRTVVIIVNTNK